jgi:Uma2 family endonuclease
LSLHSLSLAYLKNRDEKKENPTIRHFHVAHPSEPQLADNYMDTLLNPTLLVEVLSPSTEAYDRGRKFEHYRSIDSLREYLMVASDRVRADLLTRQSDGRWLPTSATSLEGSLELQSISCTITLGDLYERVVFAEPDTPTPPQA